MSGGQTAGRRAWGWIALAITIAVILAYLRPLVLGDTFALRDHVTLTIPSKTALAASLGAGIWPEWWDGVGLGINMAGNPMHSVGYPPAMMVALLPMPWAVDVLAILHVLWFGIGIARLANRLGASPLGCAFAGMAAVLCGYTGSMVVNGVPLFTLAWTPWVLWALDTALFAAKGAERWQRAALAGVLFGLQIASGDPAGLITSGLLALSWTMVRSPSRKQAAAWLVGIFGIGALLAAPTLLPALWVLPESARAGGIDVASAGSWSMHPLRALELLWPNILGDPSDPRTELGRLWANTALEDDMGSGWALSLYLGAPVLAFGWWAGARQHRGLLAVSLVFVILALGTFTPVYEAFRWLVLPERAIRYPERHLAGALCLWLPLAGVGLGRAFAGTDRSGAWTMLGGAALTALGCVIAWLGAGEIAASATGSGLDGEAAALAMTSGATAATVTAAVVASCTWAALRRPKRRRGLALFAVLVSTSSLLVETWSDQVLIDRQLLDRPPALARALANSAGDGPQPRLYRDRAMVPAGGSDPAEVVRSLVDTAAANTATRFGISQLPGYDPSISQRVHRLWEEGAAHGFQLLALFSIDAFAVPGPAERYPPEHVIGAAHGVVMLRARTRPRAFVAYQWEPGDETTALFGADFRPDAVRLEGAAISESRSTRPLSPCVLTRWRAERITLDCDAASPGYAVVLDAWAPGWTATVDGRAAELVRADRVARAVAIPAGRHRIGMVFRAPGLRLGLGIALSTAFLLLAALLWLRLRRG